MIMNDGFGSMWEELRKAELCGLFCDLPYFVIILHFRFLLCMGTCYVVRLPTVPWTDL
jgi:hypothetical protein